MKFSKWICHQRPERSFHFFGKQFPLCSRCMGLYGGTILGLVIFLFFNISVLDKWVAILIFSVLIFPMALDGFSQYLGFRMSNNILRLITGLLCGIGCGFALIYIIETITIF